MQQGNIEPRTHKHIRIRESTYGQIQALRKAHNYTWDDLFMVVLFKAEAEKPLGEYVVTNCRMRAPKMPLNLVQPSPALRERLDTLLSGAGVYGQVKSIVIRDIMAMWEDVIIAIRNTEVSE